MNGEGPVKSGLNDAFFRAMVESPLIAVGIAQGEQVVYANAALLAIFGYDSLAEFARIPLLEHVAPTSREAIATRLANPPADSRPPFVYDIVRRDGRVRTLEARSMTVVVAGESYRFTSFSDITGHQQVEAALDATAALLRATLDATADGILVVDAANKIVTHNQRFLQMWKLPPALLEREDDGSALRLSLAQLRAPDEFVAHIRGLAATPEQDGLAVVEFKDGRVFECRSQPRLQDGRPGGRVWSFRDVTEQRRAEEKLREREESLRRIFAASPDAILITDLQQIIFTCNERTAAIFGGGQCRDYVGRNLAELLAELAANPLNPDLTQLFAGDSGCVELDLVNRAGTQLVVEFSTVPLRDERSERYCQLWLGRDVTSHRALAREVIANQKRFKLLVEDSPAIVYIASEDSRANLLYISPQCEALLGRYPDDLLLAPEAWQRLVHPEDRARVDRAYADYVHRNIPFSCEYRMFNRAGGIVWFRDQVRTIHDHENRVMYRQGVMIDISELKAADEKLALLNHTLEMQVEQRSRELISTYAELCRQEVFFQTVVEETGDLIMVCDQDLRISYCNRIAREMLGYEPAEMTGRPIGDFLYPADRAMATDFMRAVPLKADHTHFAHCRLSHRDGGIRLVDVSGRSALRLAGDRKLLLTCRDVTSRRELEEKQRAMQEQQARLERLASLSALSASIVHEINQPLHAIRVLVEGKLFWSVRGKAIAQDEMQQTLRGTMSQLHRVDEIVRHIRSFAALDQAVGTSACDLNAVVEAALQLLGSNIARHNIRPVPELTIPLPPVLGNAHRLEEVVANLLLNAVQAYDHSATAIKELRCRTYTDDGMVMLEIDDNATGIPPENVGRIFEPLFTTKGASEGMGLGLSLAQTVIGGYGGTVEAENNARGGATFRLRLPAMTRRRTDHEHPAG